MTNLDTQKIVIYGDGACSGNPGPGGWGSIVATPDGLVRELGGYQAGTTNNQMELTAVIEALRAVRDVPRGDTIILTDSVYVIRGITQWIWGWSRRGWKTAEGKDVLNKEHWQALASEVEIRKKSGKIDWRFVRGHSGTPGNERCDQIAVAFSQRASIDLFIGSHAQYYFSIFDLPPEQALPEMKNGKQEKKVAHSYLSLVGTIPMRHTTWADCERRVKGQSGAKYKKAQSSDDEASILKSWGVDPKNLKS